MSRLRAAVPKATVYKNRDTLLSKNKVRFTKDRLSTPPAPNAVRPKERDHPELGIPISAAADQRHDGATFFRRENVRHVEASN
jgi:hypothetical protein